MLKWNTHFKWYMHTHTHEWHCHDGSVNGAGPFIWTIQAHRIEYFLLPLSLLILLPPPPPPLLMTSKRFSAFSIGDEIWTRDTTQNGKITKSFTVYLYEAVKLTFQTLALNYLKMKNFDNNNKNSRQDTKSKNMREHSGKMSSFFFLHQILKSPEWILIQSVKWAVGDF